jgi:hypothetical protein
MIWRKIINIFKMIGHWEHKSTHGKSMKDNRHQIIRIIGQKDNNWITEDRLPISEYDLHNNYIPLDVAVDEKGTKPIESRIKLFENFEVVVPIPPTINAGNQTIIEPYNGTVPQLPAAPLTPVHEPPTIHDVFLTHIKGSSFVTLTVEIPANIDKLKKAIDLFEADVHELAEVLAQNVMNNHQSLQKALIQSIELALMPPPPQTIPQPVISNEEDLSFINDVINTYTSKDVQE